MGDVFYFDLDQPISERYVALFPKYIPLIRQYVKVWLESSQFTDEQLSTFDTIKSYHPDRELIEECEYLSKVCNIPFRQILSLKQTRNILFLQYMYDFGFNDNNFGCTSIIVNKENPFIIRNLDWDYNDLIRALTINAIYTRKGEVVFTQLTIVGQMPVAHTLKNKIASISLHFLQPEYSRQQLLQNLIQNPQQPSIIRFLRKLLEEFNTFEKIEEAIHKIITQHHGILNVISAQKCCSYYIKDWTLNQKLQSTQVNKLLVVTNGDYFEFSTQRREAAEQKIQLLQEITKDNLIKIIREYPNNNETTIYTTVLECDTKPFIIIN